MYTPLKRKTFVINVGKRGAIFRILSLADLSSYNKERQLTSTAFYRATQLC